MTEEYKQALDSMEHGNGVLYKYFDNYDEARAFRELISGYFGYYFYGNNGIVYPVYKEI